MNLGVLNAKVSLTTSQFSQGVSRVVNGFSKMGQKAIVLNQAVDLTQRVFRGLTSVVRTFDRQILGAQVSADKFRIRLESLTGSVQSGAKVFKDMADYASAVPFEFENVMNSAANLAGIMDAKEIKEWMPLIGDLAAATGLSMEETTAQVQRMLSAGAASADMFREKGVLAMLGFTAGVRYSVDETRKMLWGAWADADSQFRGVTEKMAMTWEGQMSMMADKWFKFRLMILQSGLGDWLTAALLTLNKSFDDMIAKGDDFAKTVSDSVIKGLEGFIMDAAGAIDRIAPVIEVVYKAVAFIASSFASLPKELQQMGILGILLFGKQGAKAVIAATVLLGAGMKAVDSAREQIEVAKLYDTGKITRKEMESVQPGVGDPSKARELLAKYGIVLESPEEMGAAQTAVKKFIEQIEANRKELEKKRAEWAKQERSPKKKKGVNQEADSLLESIALLKQQSEADVKAAKAGTAYKQVLLGVEKQMDSLEIKNLKLASQEPFIKKALDEARKFLTEKASEKFLSEGEAVVDAKAKLVELEISRIQDVVGKSQFDIGLTDHLNATRDEFMQWTDAFDQIGDASDTLKQKIDKLVERERFKYVSDLLKSAFADIRAELASINTKNMVDDLMLGASEIERVMIGAEAAARSTEAAKKLIGIIQDVKTTPVEKEQAQSGLNALISGFQDGDVKSRTIFEVAQALDAVKRSGDDAMGMLAQAQSGQGASLVDIFIGQQSVDSIEAAVRAQFQPALDILEQAVIKYPELQGYVEQFKNTVAQQVTLSIRVDGLDEILRAQAQMRNMMSIATNARDALQQMQRPLEDALTTFATTGKFAFKELAGGLLKALQMFAAQKTAHFLMEAAYAGIMALAKAFNPVTAWEVPFWKAQAVNYLQGAAIMGSFVLGSGLAGMAHSGMSEIPEQGTWLLDKGERVVDSKTNEDLKEYLKQGGKGDVNIDVTINGGDEEGVLRALPELQRVILDSVSGDIASYGQVHKSIRQYVRG